MTGGCLYIEGVGVWGMGMKGGGGKKEQIVGVDIWGIVCVDSSVTWRRVVAASQPPSPTGALPLPPSRSPAPCTRTRVSTLVGAGLARHEAQVLREIPAQRIG